MTAAPSRRGIVNEGAASLPMPFVSDLDAYVEYARAHKAGAGGTLSYPGYTYTDATGAEQMVAPCRSRPTPLPPTTPR